MSTRDRIAAYGVSGLLIAAGAVCGATIGGETGGVLAIVLIGAGALGIVGMVFMEVGLSEDRDRTRARRAEERAKRAEERASGAGGARPAPRFRLGRMRGQRRRLR